MKNDLWYVGNENWVAYTEYSDIITEFKHAKEMQLAATYFHYRRGGIRAAQFNFYQGEELKRGQCLLWYVCSRMHIDFDAAVMLYRNNDNTPYSGKYPQSAYQMELFPEFTSVPPKKAKKSKST